MKTSLNSQGKDLLLLLGQKYPTEDRKVFVNNNNLGFFPTAAEWPTWLPLYGNLCCKLVAQPVCMTQHMMAGYLSQKVR